MSHMKRVDHRVRNIDADAYAHNIITEHSLSPAPNNWVIVPAKLDKQGTVWDIPHLLMFLSQLNLISMLAFIEVDWSYLCSMLVELQSVAEGQTDIKDQNGPDQSGLHL